MLCYPFVLFVWKKNGVWSSPPNNPRKKNWKKKNGWKIQNVSFDLCIFTHIIRKGFLCCKIIGQRSKLKTDFLWNFAASSALVLWYLLNLTKVGSPLLREFLGRCVSFWRKFFSEKFAGNSHTFTQKWRRATKESSSCVKKEPIPPDQLALCHTRVILLNMTSEPRKKSVKQKCFFLKKNYFFCR